MSATTNTVRFRRPTQWCMVNLLFKRSIAGSSSVTFARLRTDAGGADNADLFEVEGRGFIEAADHPGIPLNQLGPNLNVVTVRLTAAGKAWVLHDPGNTVLYGIAERSGSCALRQVVTNTAVDDHGVYQWLADKGWITVTAGQDGPPMRVLSTDGRSGSQAWLTLTAKGRQVTV